MVFPLLVVGANGSTEQPLTPEATNIGEGKDFATQVLKNPWDMAEFSDISQWINHAVDPDLIGDLRVANGVFSGRANGNYTDFYPLFPGYEPGVILPGTGAYSPISSSEFGCFYAAMKMDVPSNTTYYYTVFWGKDRSAINEKSPTPKGWTSIDPAARILDNLWNLYRLDLRNTPYQEGDRWLSEPAWQTLRVSPLINAPNATFAVDWIRLTDCAPVIHTLQNLPSGTFTLWLGAGTPERQIRVAADFSPTNGRYAWDIQGIAPGTYNYYVRPAGNPTATPVSQGQITIVPRPIIRFVKPSPFSGPDYSTAKGDPWDMANDGDVLLTWCANGSIDQGVFRVVTRAVNQLPANCIGSSDAREADPQLFLNTPIPQNMTSYRYLSFRHNIQGAWSVPEKGMIVRWMWAVERPEKLPCYYVSRDIALDVGWHTYTIDLYDLWNGTPAQVNHTDCPQNVHWKDQTGTISMFRLDPNENITSTDFVQEFDWIRLTQVESVQRGVPYRMAMKLNKPETGLTLNFYYTTNPVTSPKQNAVRLYTPATSAPAIGEHAVYIPVTVNRYLDLITGDVSYYWDTSGVAAGQYYLCVEAGDGYNQSLSCSEAPVQIINP
jgi:hypothetical protein